MWDEESYEGKLRRTLVVLVVVGGITAANVPILREYVAEWTIAIGVASGYVISLWAHNYKVWTMPQRACIGALVGVIAFMFVFNTSIDILRITTVVVGACLAGFIFLRSKEHDTFTKDG